MQTRQGPLYELRARRVVFGGELPFFLQLGATYMKQKVYAPSSLHGGAIGPTSILRTLYTTSPSMMSAQQAQHDSHEMLLALLSALHSSSRGNTATGCNCIVHGTFGGVLQSSVECGKCGNVNVVKDPMLDISLELTAVKGEKETLEGCLRRYVEGM